MFTCDHTAVGARLRFTIDSAGARDIRRYAARILPSASEQSSLVLVPGCRLTVSDVYEQDDGLAVVFFSEEASTIRILPKLQSASAAIDGRKRHPDGCAAELLKTRADELASCNVSNVALPDIDPQVQCSATANISVSDPVAQGPASESLDHTHASNVHVINADAVPAPSSSAVCHPAPSSSAAAHSSIQFVIPSTLPTVDLQTALALCSQSNDAGKSAHMLFLTPGWTQELLNDACVTVTHLPSDATAAGSLQVSQNQPRQVSIDSRVVAHGGDAATLSERLDYAAFEDDFEAEEEGREDADAVAVSVLPTLPQLQAASTATKTAAIVAGTRIVSNVRHVASFCLAHLIT